MNGSSIDERTMRFIVDHRTPVLDDVALVLMHVGQSDISSVVVVLATLAVTVRTRRWSWGIGVCIAAVGALVVAKVGKLLIQRPRPPVADAMVVAHGWSMPSSVAVLCAAMAVAAVVGWTDPQPGGRRRGAIAVTVLALIFGWAVMYLGAHWLTDVLVGWALGALVGLAAVPLGRWVATLLQRWVPGIFRWLDRFGQPVRVGRSDAVVDAEQA